MPIKFACPHCKRGLSVKDHLAGKRAACPACKKPLTIPKRGSSTDHAPLPAPTAAAPPSPSPPLPPNLDAEDAAAEAFGDAPTAAPVEAKTVDFNCPFCDEPLKLSLDLAGKKTSCPECRRIIKVPELAKQDPKDWRKTARTGPSAAKGPDVPAPEGVWGSATPGHVSREALAEADVLPDRKTVPLTTRQKISRGIWLGVGVVSLLVAGYLTYRWIDSSREQRVVNSVLAFAGSDDAKSKVGRDGVAVLYLSTGQYYLQTKRGDTAVEARKQFDMALKQLNTGGDGPGGTGDREGVLIDLAVAAVDLVGTKEQVDDGLRLDEKDSQKELRGILEAIHNPEPRLEALRLVTRRLLALHQPQRALALAAQTFSGSEEKSAAVALVGLELVAANELDLAGKAADQALAPFPVADSKKATESKTPPAPPAVIALATVLKRKVPTSDEDTLLLGQVEALGWQRRFDEARKQAAPVTPDSLRLKAYVAATGEMNPDKQTVEDAINQIGKAKSAWTLLHLVRLGVEAGVESAKLQQAANAIAEPALKARAQLLSCRRPFRAAPMPWRTTPWPLSIPRPRRTARPASCWPGTTASRTATTSRRCRVGRNPIGPSA